MASTADNTLNAAATDSQSRPKSFPTANEVITSNTANALDPKGNFASNNNLGIFTIQIGDDFFDYKSAIGYSTKPYADTYEAAGSPKGSSDQTTTVAGLFAKSPSSNLVIPAGDKHNYNLSGTLQLADPYRNGVEVSDTRKWTSGFSKITSGERGHLTRRVTSYGDTHLDIVLSNFFQEVDYFNPIAFMKAQTNSSKTYVVTFPIIVSDSNQRENTTYDGIVELFPIREVAAFTSIFAPHQPRGVFGQYGNGNFRRAISASDEVVSVLDYKNLSSNGRSHFLDGAEKITFTAGETTVQLGQSIEFFTSDENVILPFEDAVYPRDHGNYTLYSSDLSSAISSLMYPMGDTYIREKQKSCATGFVYDNAGIAGVDSIAFGGLTYS